MIIDKIDFSHFMIEVKQHIQPEHLVYINPNLQSFHKIGNVYCSLFFNFPMISIEYAVNTGKEESGDWIKAIVEQSKKQGYKTLVFSTSENNKSVQYLANKWGAKQTGYIEKFYSSGEGCFTYEYDLVCGGNQ